MGGTHREVSKEKFPAFIQITQIRIYNIRKEILNRLPHRRNKGCSVYTETEHPLMTNHYSDIIRIERLHQKMRNFLSLIYDDIICYLHFFKLL